MNAIVKTQSDDALVDVLRSSFYPEASPESVRLVLGYCRAANLDPMKKPVHIVPMWNRKSKSMQDVVMPGVGLYRIEAARTGEYVGKSEPEFGPDITRKLSGVEVTFPSWCRMTVQRLVQGRVCEYTAKEFWLENYATAGKESEAPNQMWKKRPYAQLAKCAESQVLRMAFPEQTGGTNTADEMEGKTFDGMTIDGSAEHAPAPASAASAQPVDHVQVMQERLARCTDAACVLREGERWTRAVTNAKAAGRSISEDVCVSVTDLLADALGRFEQQAPEYGDAAEEGMPA